MGEKKFKLIEYIYKNQLSHNLDGSKVEQIPIAAKMFCSCGGAWKHLISTAVMEEEIACKKCGRSECWSF